MEKILVVGVFDLFHRGHVELLKKAYEVGGEVYVVVNGDSFTEHYKRKPIYSETDRLEIVKSISYVKDAEISNSPDIKPYIEKYKITKIVHGDEWGHTSYLQQIKVTEAYLSDRNVKVVYVPYYDGISTTQLIKNINIYHLDNIQD